MLITPASETERIFANAKHLQAQQEQARRQEYIPYILNTLNESILQAARAGQPYIEEDVETWAVPQVIQALTEQGYYVRPHLFSHKIICWRTDSSASMRLIPTGTEPAKTCRIYLTRPEPLLKRLWRGLFTA